MAQGCSLPSGFSLPPLTGNHFQLLQACWLAELLLRSMRCIFSVQNKAHLKTVFTFPSCLYSPVQTQSDGLQESPLPRGTLSLKPSVHEDHCCFPLRTAHIYFPQLPTCVGAREPAPVCVGAASGPRLSGTHGQTRHQAVIQQQERSFLATSACVMHSL